MSLICKLLPFILLLLLPVKGIALDRVGFLPDPQIGKDCSIGTYYPPFANMSEAECQAFQGVLLNNILSYYQQENITDVVLMGDHTDNTQGSGARPDQVTVLTAELAKFPSMTFHRVIGNHDTDFTCKNLPYLLIDFYDNSGPSTNLWDTISVGKMRIFTVTTALWSYNWPYCYPPPLSRAVVPQVTLYTPTINLAGRCTDKTRADLGACTAGSATDAAGIGSCNSDERCVRYDEYPLAQVAGFQAAVTAYNAEYVAGTASSFIISGHHAPWTVDDVDNHNNNNNSYHNFMTCDGGADDGLACNSTYDCAGGVACDQPVSGYNIRTQVETIAKTLATKFYGVSGHIHRNIVFSGTTLNGVSWEFFIDIGTGTSYAVDYDFAGLILDCTDAGVCTKTRVVATEQGVELYGASLYQE